MNYSYQFSVGEDALNNLRSYSIAQWNDILQTVLEQRPIADNIDFSDSRPITRFKELYSILTINKIDVRPFQGGLINLFIEYWGNQYRADETCALIQLIDYVKPSLYFPQLENCVTNIEYKHTKSIVTEDGILIYFQLVNAILAFDSEGKILDHLKNFNRIEQPLVYYQIVIRHIYYNNNQSEFDEFMNSIVDIAIQDRNLLNMIILVLDEYVFYKNSFEIIYYWIFTLKDEISSIKEFALQLLVWIESNQREFVTKNYFYALYTFLVTATSQKVIPPDYITKLIYTKENALKNRDNLLHYIGTKYINADFLSQTLDLIPESEMQNKRVNSGVDQINAGLAHKKNESYMHVDKATFKISNDAIHKSKAS